MKAAYVAAFVSALWLVPMPRVAQPLTGEWGSPHPR